MSDSRAGVLGDIRRALKRGEPTAMQRQVAADRIAAAATNILPARGQLDPKAQVALFQQMAEEAAATVTRVRDAAAVPAAIAEYLARENLPARLRLSTEADITGLPWSTRPLLEISRGATDGSDEVSVTGGYAGIAETGTLMLASGADRPTTLNFLPETHIVVLPADRVVGALEQAWARLRGDVGAGNMPRTVNFITGPSRSADIEQTLQMGAHGPRRLHIVIVDGETTGGS
ncbi:MAG TPA: LUD domain-containing protein [Dongiaceae bacterium]